MRGTNNCYDYHKIYNHNLRLKFKLENYSFCSESLSVKRNTIIIPIFSVTFNTP